MGISIANQASIFLITVCVGFFIGFVYDLFRIFRRTVKHLSIFIQIEDFLYWIFVSLVMYYILLHKNYGEVRAFSIIGAFIGMIIYFFTLSQIFVPITVKIIKIIKKIIYFIIKIVLTPIRCVLKLLQYPYNLLKKIYRRFKTISYKLGRKGKTKIKKSTKGFIKDMKIILNKK